MEIVKRLKTVGGQATVKTKIKGKLDCIIVKPISAPLGTLDIIVESPLGYLILKKEGVTGTQYIVPRKQSTPVDSENYDSNAAYEKFSLNELISITIIGTDVTADVIMRF